MVRIDVVEVVGRRELAGRAAAEADYPALYHEERRTQPGDVVAFDIGRATSLTVSYFLAGLWPFWVTPSHADPDRFPVLVNAAPLAIEEVEFALKHVRAAVWAGRWLEGRGLSDVKLLGGLDPPFGDVLDQLVRSGEASAAGLAAASAEQRVGITAWNNRLAALHRLRLVRRQKRGRRLMYGPSFMEK